MNFRSFEARLASSSNVDTFEELAAELDDKGHDKFCERQKALAEKVASSSLPWGDVDRIAGACPCTSTRHLVLQRYTEEGKLVGEKAGTIGSLVAVSECCDFIERGKGGGEAAFSAVREAAKPLFKPMCATMPELVLMAQAGIKVGFSEFGASQFVDALESRGCDLCPTAPDAVRFAWELPDPFICNTFLGTYAERMAKANALDTANALELLRGLKEEDPRGRVSSKAVRGHILELLAPSLNQGTSYDDLKELAGFVIEVMDNGDEDDAGGLPEHKALDTIIRLMDPHVTTPREAMELALLFHVPSGHHGVLTAYAKRLELSEEACMLFALFVIPDKPGADGLLSVLKERGKQYGFNPLELIDQLQRLRPSKSVTRVIALGGTDECLHSLMELYKEQGSE